MAVLCSLRPNSRTAYTICTDMAICAKNCQLPSMAANSTSTRWVRTKCSPSNNSARNERVETLGTGSSIRMPRNNTTEPTSKQASATMASGAPSKRISAPAKPGPVTSASELASAFCAWARTSWSRPTSWMSTSCAAEPATVYTQPRQKATRYINGMDKSPIHQARGISNKHAPISNSPAI